MHHERCKHEIKMIVRNHASALEQRSSNYRNNLIIPTREIGRASFRLLAQGAVSR